MRGAGHDENLVAGAAAASTAPPCIPFLRWVIVSSKIYGVNSQIMGEDIFYIKIQVRKKAGVYLRFNAQIYVCLNLQLRSTRGRRTTILWADIDQHVRPEECAES